MRTGDQTAIQLTNSAREHQTTKAKALPGGRDPAAERWRGLGQRPITCFVSHSFECNTATQLAMTPQPRKGVRGAKLPGMKTHL